MKIIPDHSALQRHIEYFWVVKNATSLFSDIEGVYDFPGTSPEIILVLDGQFGYKYHGRIFCTSKSTLISYIDSFFQLRPANLKSFIVIRFKSRSLSSLQPFINFMASDLIANPIIPLEDILNKSIRSLTKRWKSKTEEEIIPELNDWLLSMYKENKEGFVTEIFENRLQVDSNFKIADLTHYSHSTLLRYFKKESGLSPKHFQSLRRFRACMDKLYTTNNTDWISYVEEFGYHDQSHFIKEIKRFSQFTPTQLLNLKSLKDYRPV